MIARLFSLLLVTGLVLAAWPAATLAHVNLSRSDPPQDATLSEPPETVTMWFSGRIEPDFSSIEVKDADGRQVDKGNSRVHANRRVLEVGLEELGPGEYHVDWSVVARDGHRQRGHFMFTVE